MERIVSFNNKKNMEILNDYMKKTKRKYVYMHTFRGSIRIFLWGKNKILFFMCKNGTLYLCGSVSFLFNLSFPFPSSSFFSFLLRLWFCVSTHFPTFNIIYIANQLQMCSFLVHTHCGCQCAAHFSLRSAFGNNLLFIR